MHEARDIVRATGAVASSLATAEAYVASASDALADLDVGDARRALEGAADHLLVATRDIVADAAA